MTNYQGSGKVFFSQKEYECCLYFTEKEEQILLTIRVKHDSQKSYYFEMPFEIHHLYGRLETGFEFMLLKLYRLGIKENPATKETEFSFCADYIICGVNNTQQEQTFYKASFTISNIIEWGGISVYNIGNNHELIHECIPKIIEILHNESCRVFYSVNGSFFPFIEEQVLQDNLELKQIGDIVIEFSNDVSFSSFIEVLKSIKSLIEIALLRKVNISRVSARSKSVVSTIDDTTIERSIDIYGKGIHDCYLNEGTTSHNRQRINLSELLEHNSFDQYFKKKERLAPIIELYLEPFYVDGRSSTGIFLSIVQALETYHSRFITNSIDEFIARIENIVKNTPKSEATVTRQLLIANSKSFITLESRLADLLLANHHVLFDTGRINYQDFPSIIAHTRNYYTHYDERIKENYKVLSPEELTIYNQSLYQILEYYILLELGFVNDAYATMTKHERWSNITQRIEIMELSKSHYKA